MLRGWGFSSAAFGASDWDVNAVSAGLVFPVGAGDDGPDDADDNEEPAGPEGYFHDEGNEVKQKPGGDEAESEDDKVLGHG